MTWDAPTWLWGLILPVLLGALFAVADARALRALRRVFGEGMLARVLPEAVRRRRQLASAFGLAGLLAVIVALAQPQLGTVPQEIRTEGVDLVVALDLSRSMDARDVDPSRLERARREVLDLLDRLGGDRVGLVLFAGGAYPRMPLTEDHGAVRTVLATASSDIFEAQGSNVAEAIRVSLELLDGPSPAGRAILLLTDGEVHDPVSARAAAEAAATQGVVIYGLVVGTGPARIPDGPGRDLRDPSTGEIVLSEPTDAVLAELARSTGGAVLRSVASDADVAALVQSELRGRLQSAELRRTSRQSHRSVHEGPLALGTALLFLAALLGDGRLRSRPFAALAAGAALWWMLARPPAALAGPVHDAEDALREGDAARAVELLTPLVVEAPDDADLLRRLGVARYRAGDAEGAVEAFRAAESAGGTPDDAFNTGNALVAAGRLEEALDAYERALAGAPEHVGATTNREIIAQELMRRRQQQQQQQQRAQGGEGEAQEGEQGEDAEAQDAGAAQPGEPDEQEPREGEPDGNPPAEPPGSPGAPPPGTPPDATDAPPDGSPGEPQQPEAPTEDGGEREAEGEDGVASLEDLEGATGDPSTEAGDSPQEGAPASESQESAASREAERLLDGVEEGRPRVYVPGRTKEKPW